MMQIADKFQQKWRNRWIIATTIAVLSALLVWGAWYRNPLPSDAQLVEHFNAHRAEFEQLVQGYRNYRRSDIFYELSSDEVNVLAKRLGVYRVVEANGVSGIWFPDGYSPHTIQIVRSLNVRKLGETATEHELMTTLRHEMPSLFVGVAPVNNGWDVIKISAVIHVLMGSANQSDKLTLRYGGIHKGYYYFPQVPKIDVKRIVQPEYYNVDERVQARFGQRVFDSLDVFPSAWQRGECVLKRVAEHWFLAMCRNG